jgi:hypothetical protein
VQIKYPDPQVVCDECEQAESESEAVAEAKGWLVGYDSDTQAHSHICPARRAATA